jgi:hypothetical protein
MPFFSYLKEKRNEIEIYLKTQMLDDLDMFISFLDNNKWIIIGICIFLSISLLNIAVSLR